MTSRKPQPSVLTYHGAKYAAFDVHPQRTLRYRNAKYVLADEETGEEEVKQSPKFKLDLEVYAPEIVQQLNYWATARTAMDTLDGFTGQLEQLVKSMAGKGGEESNALREIMDSKYRGLLVPMSGGSHRSRKEFESSLSYMYSKADHLASLYTRVMESLAKVDALSIVIAKLVEVVHDETMKDEGMALLLKTTDYTGLVKNMVESMLTKRAELEGIFVSGRRRGIIAADRVRQEVKDRKRAKS